MASAVAAPNFGNELKDSFKSVNAWVAGGIGWLDEVEQFYRERSAIEKEYAAKLSALAKKYHEKKGRKLTSLSVGETPTLTPGSLENASMTTWATQLQTLEKRSSEHERLAVDLVSQIADPLKHFATKMEELRKNHTEYNTKLEKERDAAYTALKRQKGKYDSACQELESKRKKQDSSFDMNKAKAQQSYNAQVVETNNVKNTYLIAIRVTNKSKEHYYHDYIPELINSLQDLNETRVAHLNNVWKKAVALEDATLNRSSSLMQTLSSEIPRNEPYLDSGMFAQHNRPDWKEPADFAFEASPIWHDDANFMTDETAKIYLRNILSRGKASRTELKQDVTIRQKEVERLKQDRQAIKQGRTQGDEVNLVQLLFTLQGNLHEAEQKWMTAETEVQTILGVVGDISIGAKHHNFKSTTFKIPTNCDLCGDRIWGLSAKGFDCRDCGYTCHSKCELKVPADCPGELSKDERKKMKAERQEKANEGIPVPEQANYVNGSSSADPSGASELPGVSRSNTMNSLSSGYAASAARSVSDSTNTAPSSVAARPSISGGRKSRMVAPPPTSFVGGSGGADAGAISELPAEPAPPPPVVPSRPGLEVSRGKMTYAFSGSGDGELSLDEGQEFTIVEADDGSGWMTVKTATGEQGVVPASYVEKLAVPAQPPISSHLSPASAGTAGLPPAVPLATRPRPISSYSNASSTGSGAGPGTGPGTAASASTASLASVLAGGGAATTTVSGGSSSSHSNNKKKQGPLVAPKRGAKKLTWVTALYDYSARSDGEFSMREGERFVLISRDAAGDGWADVERNGVRGSVPASYIE